MQLLFILFLALLTSSHAEEVVLDFDKIPEYLTDKNGEYKGSLLERDAQEAKTGYLGRSFLPTFKIEAGTANTSESFSKKTQSYNYLESDVDINIFKGGRDKLEENSRQASFRISGIRAEQVKFNNLEKARSLYWSLVYQKELTRILNYAISLTLENQKAAQKRIAGGIATVTDRIDFEQVELQYSQDLQKSQIMAQNIERELAAVLNFNGGTTFKTQDLIPHSHDHTKSEFAEVSFKSEEHRDYRFFEETNQQFTFDQIKLGRWWTPHIDLYAGVVKRTDNFSQENAYTVVQENGFIGGVRMIFEFDGFESQALSKSSSYQALGSTYFKNQKRVELEADFNNVMKLIDLNHALVHSSEDNIKKSEQYLKNTREEYLRGIKNSPDVLQASQRLISAELRYAEVKKDYQLARVEILGLLAK